MSQYYSPQHTKSLSDKQLLNLYSQIMEELRGRKVVRTSNNPVADYGEKIVAEKLNLKLMPSSNTGFDATDLKSKTRYQIKTRRLKSYNKSRQLGVIRNLERNEFDYLIAVIFGESFNVEGCYQIPLEVIKEYGRISEHQNGYVLVLKGKILEDKRVKDITNIFK